MARESCQTIETIIYRCRTLGLEPKNIPEYCKNKKRHGSNIEAKYESAFKAHIGQR